MKPFSEISPRRAAATLAAVAGLLSVAAVAAQVVLPRFAESRIRAHLAGQATGLDVDVQATPAVKLLLGRVDRVKITADHLRADGSASQPSLEELLARAGAIRKLDVRVRHLEAPRGIEVRNVALRKDGDAVAAEAALDPAKLRDALPPGLEMRPLPAPDGQLLLEGTAAPFGARLTARARVLTEDGRVVVRAEGQPFASLVTMPVVSSDRIAVDRLAATPSADGLVVRVRAHLR